MSNYLNHTQRQNTFNANMEVITSMGIGLPPPHPVDHYRYCSSHSKGMISRGVQARMLHVCGGHCPYPTLLEIANHTCANQLQHDNFSDLRLGDIVFASAVTVVEVLAPKRDLHSAEVPALCGLIDHGLFNRDRSEPHDTKEERAMRYAATVGGYLLDYAHGTQLQVCSCDSQQLACETHNCILGPQAGGEGLGVGAAQPGPPY